MTSVEFTLLGHMPEVEIDHAEIESDRSRDTRRDHAPSTSEHRNQLSRRIERIDVAVASDPKQDLAERTVLDRKRPRTQTTEVDPTQVRRRLYITIEASIPVRIELTAGDQVKSTGVGHGVQLVAYQFDAGHRATIGDTTDCQVARGLAHETTDERDGMT